MTFLFILCPLAIVALAACNLISTGTGGGEVKERMARRNGGQRTGAPMAPKVKYDPTATTHGGEVTWTESDRRTSAPATIAPATVERPLPVAA